MSTVETRVRSLAWIEGTTAPTFMLISRRRESRGENTERGDGKYVMGTNTT
jgi:hypothetical protein